MSEDQQGESSNTAPARSNVALRGLPCGAILAILFFVLSIGSPGLFNNPGANGGESGALRAQPVKDELIIRYSRTSREEAVGMGVDSEYAEVAALVLQEFEIPPEQLTIMPLYQG